MSRSLRLQQYLVYGYTKEIEKEYNLDCHVPEDVVNLMLFFYETIRAPIKPIVIDNGSVFIKSGFGKTCSNLDYDSEDSEEDEEESDEDIDDSDQIPRSILPTIVGDELVSRYPIEGGLINNWNDMVCIYYVYCLNL